MVDEDGRCEPSGPVAPPPPCDQVVAHREEESARDERAGADAAPSTARPSRAKAPVASRAHTPSGGLRRPVVAAVVVACICALAAGVAIAAATASGGLDEADERAMTPATSDMQRTPSAEDSAEAERAHEELALQLAALAADDEGSLSRHVQAFMADYDAGVDRTMSYGFSDLGISVDELAEKLKDGLAFHIESIDVYGSKAWVDVSVVSKSFSDQADVFAAAVGDAAADYEDADRYKAYLKEALLDSFDRVEPRTGSTLVVVERDGDGWSLASDDVASLLGDAWYG